MKWQEVVSNYKVYDLEESTIASGYPMQTELVERKMEERDVNRLHKLSAASDSGNQAHGQALSGIVVNFDLTLTNKGWVEAERYRFLTFVSSQSTMHRITKFNIAEQYIEYTDPRIIKIIQEKIDNYNNLQSYLKDEGHQISPREVISIQDELKRKYLEILYSNPAGFKLTARMSTNYRCLKNIYIQRKNHRLPEWRAFCDWIETLPYFEEYINTNDLAD